MTTETAGDARGAAGPASEPIVVTAEAAAPWTRLSSRLRARSSPAEATRPGVLAGLHPLLFAAYPILGLWAQNVGEVRPGDVGDVLWSTLTVVVLATALLGGLCRDRRRGALIVTPVVLGFFLYGAAGELGLRPEARIGIWLVVIGLAIAAAIRLGAARLGRLDTLLRRLAILIVGISLVGIVPTELEEALHPAPIVAGGRTLPTETEAQKRDVYWIVLDRYGSDRSFELQFGVRSPLTAWLSDRGFEVLPDSHANYVATALSMSTTLNMTHLEEIVEGVPPYSRSYAPTYDVLQSSLVVRQFQALGYRYLHLGSWWNATRVDEAADRNYNADGVSDFTAAVLETSVLPDALTALGRADLPPPTEVAKHLTHNAYALDVLDRLPSEPGPKLVVAHLLLPHPPYVFDRDGRPIPTEEAATLEPADAWRRQLDYTNARLQAFLARLLDIPEAVRPIVILQADEGPWPDRYTAGQIEFDWSTATDRELEIKFGILNAWLVPSDVDLGLDPAQTAINTFPILFDRYFGLDYSLLPERISVSRSWWQPYRLIEVTDRLRRPAAG